MYAGPIFNLVVNTTAACGLSKAVSDDKPRDVAIIVIIDTIFRMVISNVLTALKFTPKEHKTVGELIFLCSTLITQPISVKIAETFFKVKAPSYLNTLAYIFFGWKANIMTKDVIFLAYPGIFTANPKTY
jgi:hypothetical protein